MVFLEESRFELKFPHSYVSLRRFCFGGTEEETEKRQEDSKKTRMMVYGYTYEYVTTYRENFISRNNLPNYPKSKESENERKFFSYFAVSFTHEKMRRRRGMRM